MARGESAVIDTPHTSHGVTVYSSSDDGAEWFVCEKVGELVVPLEGPFQTSEIAIDAAVRIASEHFPTGGRFQEKPERRKDHLSPAGMAALLAMLKAGTLKINE